MDVALNAVVLAGPQTQLGDSPDPTFHVNWFGNGDPIKLASDPLFGLSGNAFVLLEFVAVVAAIGIWLVLLGAALAWTRPPDVDGQAANPDLPDDLPPAVVSLLANRWRLNEDAAESTLIDLAARHWIEFRQPGNDPTQTTVHVLPAPTGRAAQSPLTAYDQQVLEHVQDQAVNDVVPVTALTFRDVGEANRWMRQLHSSVIEDARARGLTRRRFSPALVTLLSFAAVLPSLLLAATVAFDSHELVVAGVAGVVSFTVLAGLAGRPLGERDTALGREVAARWFELRTFLRNDEAFAELPPAAVTVWDRYLSYGDALGVTRVCSALLDLGMGSRKRVWSSFGGSWHRVRVRYPKVWARYGATAPYVLMMALLTLVIGGFILKAFSVLSPNLPNTNRTLVDDVPALVGGYLVLRGAYRIVRLAGDLLGPRTLTGEVLWVELWRSTQAKEDRPAVPVIHYLALDDGTDDRTTAWALPSDWSQRAHPGDVVTVVVRPWTRRVTEVRVVSSRSARLNEAAGVTAAAGSGSVAGAAADGTTSPNDPNGSVTSGSVPTAAGMLSADEVAQALGRPLVTDATAGRFALGPFEMVVFSAPGTSSPLLMLAVARGRAVGLVMRTARRGHELAGIGDEAWLGKDWAVARRGETMIRLNLQSAANLSPQILPPLLTKALTRLP